MLEAYSKAPFWQLILKDIEAGTWIPLEVFVLRDISVTDQK